jgi:hypothetical protein
MAGEKGSDKAVAVIKAWMAAHLDTYLRAVETAQSLTADSLGEPDEYIAGLRDDDNRTSLIVFLVSSKDGDDTKLQYHDCTIAYRFSSDADIDAGSLKARRITTALCDTVNSDPTLAGAVVSAVVTERDHAHGKTINSITRHAVAIGVAVTTWDT